MKNNLLTFILVFFISAFSSTLFAQGPANPGPDPLSPSNLNEKILVPQDSASNMKTDSSKVLTFRNFIGNNFLQPAPAGSEIYYVYSEEMNKKSFKLKMSFFTKDKNQEISGRHLLCL